jgi:hypothetical protein
MEQQVTLDYDSFTQFLARLEPQHADHDHLTSPESPGDSGLSPFNSASPPGLSSGSATSHSPESLGIDWDSETFFDKVGGGQTGILPDGTPYSLVLQEQQQASVTPMSDFIKIENTQSPPAYSQEFGEPQGTISPDNSLIDPTADTAVEGRPYAFSKEDDALFAFNAFNGQPVSRNNSGDFSPMMWGPQTQPRGDYQGQNQNWQQQQPLPRQQQPQQQQQQAPQQPHVVQRTSPLRNSTSSAYAHLASSPESRADDNSDDDTISAPRPKKRKTSSDEAVTDGNQSVPAAPANGRRQPKKTAHNMIEKRYRTNLNDKIAALRDSVPSLRVMAGTARLGEDDEEEDLEGLAPAHKLNKATVLAKATEYIRHLEKRNKRLLDENDQLKNRLGAFEKLATMGGAMGLQAQSGPHAGGHGGQAGGPGGGLMSRLMVGSLAGLMVASGFQSHEESNHHSLFALPASFRLMGGATAPANDHAFMLIAKLLLLFTAVLYIISPGYFDAKDAPENTKAPSSANVSAALSLASPLKDRSHAWLTAIQTVWVPRHSVLLELAALGIKAAKLSLRRLIGWEKYRMITGMTEEQEAARVKSWTIALDAQLAGGDVSVNHSRLLLTLLASWTLPSTPARLMLNALHIRVLFSDLGSRPKAVAEKLSDFYWLEARKAQEKVSAENDTSVEQLPEYLAQLLQLDPCDVFDDEIVQKAHNLAYNRITQDGGVDEGMDSVVKDVAVRSPLDALAAWYSSLLLQGVLVGSMKSKPSESLNERIQTNLDLALRVAPTCSAVQLRALTAKAALVNGDGRTYLTEALKIFEEDLESELNQKPGTARVSVTPINSAVTTTTDIRVSLRCGMALALMRNGSRDEATRLFSDLDWQRQADKNGLGLLGFVAAWKTLTTFVNWDRDWAKDAGDSVDCAAAMLRIWIGDKKTPKFGVSRSDCNRVIDFCNSLQKKLAGLEGDNDDGYVSGELELATQQQPQTCA